jgi:hypothetical protein
VLTSTPETFAPSRIFTALERCKDDAQRARVALALMARQSGASAGFLFAVGEEAPECIAVLGTLTLVTEIARYVQEYLQAHALETDTTSTDQSIGLDISKQDCVAPDGQHYLPVLLSHTGNGETVITGVALLARSDGALLAYPAQLAAEISRFRAQQGTDVRLVVQE